MSTLASYGHLKVKRVEFADQLISHGSADDDSELALVFSNQGADRTLTFPALSGNQTILHDGSSIAATQLNINGAGAASGGAADADVMVIYDASASANKKITLAQLDSYIGHNAHSSDSITTAMLQDDCVTAAKLASDAVVDASVASGAAIAFSKLAALDDAKFLVGNGSNVAVKVAMSGDATLANNGAITIANNAINAAKLANDAVDTAAIEDDAVTAAKLASNAVVDASVASGAAIAFSKLAALDDAKFLVGNGSNVAVKVAMSGDATLANNGAITIANNAINAAKLANDAVDTAAVADDAITAAKLGAGACDATALGVTAGTVSASKALCADASKDVSGARHFTITGNSQCNEIFLGGATSWKFKIAGGNLTLQKHDGSSWVTKQVFT